jgi:hypothetical protein
MNDTESGESFSMISRPKGSESVSSGLHLLGQVTLPLSLYLSLCLSLILSRYISLSLSLTVSASGIMVEQIIDCWNRIDHY